MNENRGEVDKICQTTDYLSFGVNQASAFCLHHTH